MQFSWKKMRFLVVSTTKMTHRGVLEHIQQLQQKEHQLNSFCHRECIHLFFRRVSLSWETILLCIQQYQVQHICIFANFY